jgi:hypothetical protein
MKAVLAAALALAFCLVGPDTGYAQSAAPSTAAPAPTPTTKILAIGTINHGVEPAKVFAILPDEVRDTVDLYWLAKSTNGIRSRMARGRVHLERHRSRRRPRYA